MRTLIRNGRSTVGSSRSWRLGAVVIALTATVATALLLASVGSATLPAAGTNCTAAGKISGRGATFPWYAQFQWTRLYRDDVCGPVTDTAGPAGASTGDVMVTYNGTNGDDTTVSTQQGAYIGGLGVGNYTLGSLTGSGSGRNSALCRADAFAMSDGPYSSSQLVALRGAPVTANCTSSFDPAGTGSDYFSPFNPTTAQFPAANDIAAGATPIMSFPVTVGAVAVIVNFTSAANTTCRNTAINLTAQQVSRLFGGDIINWSAVIPGCLTTGAAEIPVKRVVRRDNSGTTQIFLNYLGNVDAARAGATCNTAIVWNKSQANPMNEGTTWPGDSATNAGCSPIVHGNVNGNPGVLNVATGTSPVPGTSGAFPQRFDASLAGSWDANGAISYVDLADEKTTTIPTVDLNIAGIRNSTNTAFASASTATGANCDSGSIQRPGIGNDGLVGLAASDTWSSNQTTPSNRSDITNKGTKYPICGMSWVLVYTGLSLDGINPNSNTRLTDAQRRNLYGYLSYILTSPAQNALDASFYTSLPPGLAADIRTGFQVNY